jgi:hypothetical protein
MNISSLFPPMLKAPECCTPDVCENESAVWKLDPLIEVLTELRTKSVFPCLYLNCLRLKMLIDKQHTMAPKKYGTQQADQPEIVSPEIKKTELEEYEERTENEIFDDDDFIGGPEDDE